MRIYYFITAFGALMFLLASRAQGKNLWGEQTLERNYSNRIIAICFAVLSWSAFFIIMAARYEVGTDYNYAYVPVFQRALSDNLEGFSWEPLFKLFYQVLAKRTDNPQWVFIITSFVITSLIWITIYMLSPIPWLSVVLFVFSRHFFIAMNGVRQYVGLAFVCIAILFLVNNNDLGYFIMVLLGTMCHYSVVIFAPLYLLCKVTIKPLQGLLGIVGASLLLPLFEQFSRWIVGNSVYSRYIDSKYDLAYRYDTAMVFQVLFILLVVLHLVTQNPIGKEEKGLRYLFNLYLLCSILSLNLNIFPNSIRIAWSLEFPLFIFLPILISRIKNRKEKILVTMVILLVYGYFMITRIPLGDHGCLPYKAIIGGREIVFV